MDPAIEMATLVVSYLWLLREIFPEALTGRDIEKAEQRQSEELLRRVWKDYALLARMRNLSRRTSVEWWGPHANAGAPLGGPATPKPPDDFDEVFDLLREKRFEKKRKLRTDEEAPGGILEGPKHYLQGIREWVDHHSTSVASRGDRMQVARQCVDDFKAHAMPLLARFGDHTLRAPDQCVTRESLTETIAVEMLQTGILADVARDLNYRPILLRDIDGGLDLLSDPSYPARLLDRCDACAQALPFSLVLHRELDEINQVRSVKGESGPGSEPPNLAVRRAYDRCLFGLALSGGGIRSATFGLGVLQGLATQGWLRRIDYLSTVSGGGYIGAWLVAWIKRRGSIRSVEESLRGFADRPVDPKDHRPRNPDPGSEHVRPIRLLREYSNYLAPRFGAFTADTWTIIAIWCRNTGLNLLVLTLFLMATLLTPRLLGLVFVSTRTRDALILAGLFLGMSSAWIGFNLGSYDDKAREAPETGWSRILWLFRPRPKPSERGDTTLLVVLTIVLPVFAAMFLATTALWAYASNTAMGGEDWARAAWIVWLAALVGLFGGMVVTLLTSRAPWAPPAGSRRSEFTARARLWFNLRGYGWHLLYSFLAAAVGASLIAALWVYVVPLCLADSRRGTWIALAFGPLALLLTISLVIVLHLGLLGLRTTDEQREWWSRLGAWLGLAAASWILISSISYFAAYGAAITGLYAGTLGLGWGALTGAGASLAASGKSNGINLPLDRNVFSSWLITSAPYLFMGGFIIGIALLANVVLYVLHTKGLFPTSFSALAPLPFSLERYVDTYWAFLDPQSRAVPSVVIALFGIAMLVGWRVDVNEFSMHHFYKNRLVRAYLGASRARVNRRPNAFTGLDMEDDIKLSRFRSQDRSVPSDETRDCCQGFTGPFPIINATMNMSSGAELAWQDRKGHSFVFTPLYCGYDFATKQTAVASTLKSQFAFRPTIDFADRSTDTMRSDAGVSIGTAMAISGAAANPNAGYHSSPPVAFLLTVFNARLGWWIGNPGRSRWKSPSPGIGLFYLLSELFGFSSLERKYVNLSDGGHFDNMGLYELVRRRCRYIIVCDAEQDDRYSFNGFAGAIRKCRVDFGVTIDIDTAPIVPDKETKKSRQHVVVGDITYPGEGRGKLVYIKASVSGDEPADVLEYNRSHHEFPHQTTTDQFFDESQFESYRALGQHVVDSNFPAWDSSTEQAFCERLKDLVGRVKEKPVGVEQKPVPPEEPEPAEQKPVGVVQKPMPPEKPEPAEKKPVPPVDGGA